MKRSPQEIQVIVAGFGRTGTSSMMRALDRLGHKTYHGVTTWAHIHLWAAVALDSGRKTNMTALDMVLDRLAHEGFTAGGDFPFCVVFEHLMQRYPDAKVILTLRSSAQLWAESFTETIARITPLSFRPPTSWLMPGHGEMTRWAYTQAGLQLDPETLLPTVENAAAAYSAWEQRVRAAVPEGNLLVHHGSADGWAPLCEMLMKPAGTCPSDLNEPYPHGNDRAEMLAELRTVQLLTDWWWLVPLPLVLLVPCACAAHLILLRRMSCCTRLCGKPTRRSRLDRWARSGGAERARRKHDAKLASKTE